MAWVRLWLFLGVAGQILVAVVDAFRSPAPLSGSGSPAGSTRLLSLETGQRHEFAA